MYRNAHDVDLIHEILVFGVARETELLDRDFREASLQLLALWLPEVYVSALCSTHMCDM